MEPIHTLESIVNFGHTSFHSMSGSVIYMLTKVHGPRGNAYLNPKHPYDLPTIYIYPVSNVRHIKITPEMDTLRFKDDIRDALIAGKLKMIPGGRQSNKNHSGYTHTPLTQEIK